MLEEVTLEAERRRSAPRDLAFEADVGTDERITITGVIELDLLV